MMQLKDLLDTDDWAEKNGKPKREKDAEFLARLNRMEKHYDEKFKFLQGIEGDDHALFEAAQARRYGKR